MESRRRNSRRWIVGGLAVLGVVGCQTGPGTPYLRDSGNLAFERGDYRTAVIQYEEYLRRRPDNALIQHRMAHSLIEIGDPLRAVLHAATAVDIDPLNDEYTETLARARFEAGQAELVMGQLRELTRERGRVTDFMRLGRYAALLGDPDTAEQAFLSAARVDEGQSVEPQLALARFYGDIGDTARETERLRNVLFIDPDNEVANKRLRVMGEIPGPSFALPPPERSLADGQG